MSPKLLNFFEFFKINIFLENIRKKSFLEFLAPIRRLCLEKAGAWFSSFSALENDDFQFDFSSLFYLQLVQ